MSETTQAPGEARKHSALLHHLLNVLGVLVVAVCFFSPARQVADVQLDSSNYSSYAYFTAKDFQFGTQVMPMAGPYGFVPYGFMYSGHLFWKRLLLELVTKIVLGVLVVWYLRRARGNLIISAFWVVLLFVMAPFIDDLPYSLAILLTGLCLIECHAAKDKRSLYTGCALSTYLALLTLFKGTQTSLAIATFGLLFFQAAFMRNFRRLPWLAASYCLALIVLLVVAGQNPLNLPQYLHGVFELSSGYNLAMGLEEPWSTFLTGAGATMGLELSLCVLLWARWRDTTLTAGCLLLAGFTFIEWKHGFVRADGHVYIFYNYACLAAPTILLFGLGPRTPAIHFFQRTLAVTLAAIALGLAFRSDGVRVFQRNYWSITMLPDRIGTTLSQLLHPRAAKVKLDRLLAAQRSVFQLPRVQEIVGQAKIDFFGTELGYLMLNKLNYRPRPMGGGPFNVFTPWLQNLNTAFVSNPATRPSYYLVEPQTIDDRYLMQDDPGTFRALLNFYRPVASELGVVLFMADPDKVQPLPTPKLIETKSIILGEPMTPPRIEKNQMLLVSFSLPLSLGGRMRASLYKPPEIFMDLEGDGIRDPLNRRIIPNFFTNPVLLSPVLEDNTDLLTLYKGSDGKLVTHFTLHSPQARLFDTRRMTVRFYSVDRPLPQPEQAAELIEALGLPITTIPPLLIESPNSPLRQFGALPVQLLEPPGRIRFALTGEEREISFVYGIDPKAYIDGETDGVGFSVDIERPHQAPQQIYHILLEPRNKPADRGTHSARVLLPLFPRGSTISLRTDRGPVGDGGWDWAFFAAIRLHVRDYLPEQFPGFSRLPSNVDATNAGAIDYHAKKLFMLNSPGSLIFALKATDSKLVFTAGLLPEAYTGGNLSDGVEFTVDLRTPDGTITHLFRALDNPRDVKSDRTDRTFSVELPDPIDLNSQLILSSLPGPANNPAWDWSYISSLHFE